MAFNTPFGNVTPQDIGGGLIGGPVGWAAVQKPQSAPYNPDYSGVAQYPGMVSPLNQQGQLQEGFKLSGPEKYGAGLQNQITWQQMQQQQQAAGNAAASAAGARGQLATHGGLNSGAAERVAQQGAQNQMNAMQQAGAGAAGSRLAAAADVQGKKMGIDQANMANTLEAQKNANAYNIAKMNSDRQLWAAQQMAKATAEAAPKPKSFLGSAPLVGDMFGAVGL